MIHFIGDLIFCLIYVSHLTIVRRWYDHNLKQEGLFNNPAKYASN